MEHGEETASAPKKDVYLTASGLTVRFGSVTALNSFSAQIPRGIVGLLGPNGAGKTTFIKAMLGHVRADEGGILINGLNPYTNITAVRDTVGYMPETDCLINDMNAVELVSYMGCLSGMTASDAIQRTHEVLDFVSIGEERYRPISSYSTGMKQKIKLAQAIVHDPAILFFDEPTNGMDPQGREEMLELIKKIGASGKSILISSHVLNEVEKVCAYVIIINNGALIKEGDIKTLMQGEKDRHTLKVRGAPGAVSSFEGGLRKKFKLISSDDSGGETLISMQGENPGREVFRLALEHGVQVRSFTPETLVLEDVFLRAFLGRAKHGN